MTLTADTLVSLSKFTTWESILSFGQPNVITWRYPHYFLRGILGNLGFGLNVTEKVLVFWPSIFAGLVGMYILGSQFGLKLLGRFIASLVFNFNTYYFSTREHFYIYSSEVFVLWMLWFYIRFIKTKKLPLLFGAAISLFVSSAFDMRGAYLGLVLLIAYVFFNSIGRAIKTWLLYATSVAIIIFIFFVISAYWVIPQVAGQSLINNAILNRQLFGNEFLSLPHLLTLHHPFWTGTAIAWFHTQPVPYIYWIIPIVAFLSFLAKIDKKVILFAALIAFIGIFLGKQVAEPFGNVYRLLFNYFPAFSAFREASKFFFYVVFGYSILFGIYSDHIQNLNNRFIQIASSFLMVITLIVVVALPSLAFIRGDIGQIDRPTLFPPMYKDVEKIISELSDDYRILWIPRFPGWVSATEQKPSVSLAYALETTWNDQFIFDKTDKLASFSARFNIFLQAPNLEQVLSEANIAYIILPLRVSSRQDDLYTLYELNQNQIIEQLDQLPFLNRFAGGNDWRVYSIRNPCSRIYIVLNNDFGQKYCQRVIFHRSNYGQYGLLVSTQDSKVTLRLSESWHPQWRLILGQFTLFERILPGIIGGITPTKTKSGFQEYTVSVSDLCSQSDSSFCQRRNNKYILKMTLQFLPQMYFPHGMLISIVALLALLYVSIRFKK